MGAYTPLAQVWYPDTSDTSEINTLMSTMASSIENGLGARMTKQELKKAIVANLQTDQTPFVNGTGQVVAYTVNSIGYNNGMTISGGRVTIGTAGQYFVGFTAFALSSSGSSSGSCLFTIRKNTSTIAAGLALIAPNGSTSAGGASGSTVIDCVAGDVLDIYAVFGGATAGTLSVSAANPAYNMFTVSLLKAS